ncbi:MAG: DNA repair protein RadC [Cellvibrionales bacterium]|jgi:DNA repair protein RadC|nr:DNA repair protein RadC [Cellvibrionales bacterium]MBK8676349.1 DNA repair protein RadC [Cellvibrionales bacterium]
MPITDWPLNERPREKLLAQGATALSDAELLAIFLRTGTRGKTAVDLARELLADFNGLRHLLSADRREFCARHGLGLASFVQLQAVLEMARRHLMETLQRDTVLNNPAEVRHYLKARLRDYRREVFVCLFLDTQHRVICCEELFQGTLDASSVYPRDVVQRALALNAAAIIFAHNHPSGIAEPSQADQRITTRLCEALALVDIRVLDHMIVGDGAVLSMAERGLL